MPDSPRHPEHAADHTATFLTALGACGLLTPDQFRDIAAWAFQTRPDLPNLAKEISRRGWLTLYQIKEIARGRGKELILDRYVLLDLLGEGGMGRVFKAHDTRLARDVALKIIRREKLSNPAAVARFQTEVEAVGRMQHPNVVTAFDAHVGAVHFCVMELIDGTDLTKLVKDRGPLPVADACEYVRQAALGLHHAFEQGLVHRDVKPSNLLLTRDGRTVKVVDLGLARLDEPAAAVSHRITQDGFVLGTPDFLAPEQARNPSGVDIRADVYALGATLFFLLTGRVPFEGATATEKMVKHCTDPPPELLPLRPDAPPPVEQIIHWCMAKRPEDRPQTPLQLALALQPFCPVPAAGSRAHMHLGVAVPPGIPGLPVPATTPERSSQLFKLPPPKDQPPARRRPRSPRSTFPAAPVLMGLGALVLVGVFAVAAYHVFRGERLPPVEPFTNSVGMKLVKIDGGTFRMGSPPGEPGRATATRGEADDEGPVHEVTVRGPFLMSATEVTHGQYLKVMGTSPRGSVVVRKAASAADHPAEMVSYDDAVEFCRRLTEREAGSPNARPGWVYRLPTEAEWEYACRAGTDGPFGTGAVLLNPRQAVFTPAADGSEVDLDGGSPAGRGVEGIPGKVGQTEPNRWGLYDMHGNVAEWCLDWYHRGYPDGPRDNPTGPAGGSRRVVRGGSFRDPASACRSAARAAAPPADRQPTIGFRVVYAPAVK